MMDCGDNSAAIELYLDKELSGRELEEFLTHLEGCVDCQAELEEKKELAGLLHRTRPLYTASDALRATVMRRTEGTSFLASNAPPRLRRRVLNL